MKVADVKVGHTITSPISGIGLSIIDTRPGMYELIELTGVDTDGDRHLLSLGPDEEVSLV